MGATVSRSAVWVMVLTNPRGPCQVEDGSVPGTRAAAVRKLWQELGIPAEQVPVDKFKFLTRLHYCADDSVTYGSHAEWGEHELDYILFIKTNVDVTPNPEEVGKADPVSH